MKTAISSRATARHEGKKAVFMQGMTQGREAMRRLREIVFANHYKEQDTRYEKADYRELRDMIPMLKMNFIYRLGHLNQLLNSYKLSALFIHIEDTVNYAHKKDAEADGLNLFYEGRQWCYGAIKKLMRTGLFSGRADAQKTLDELVQMGLIYKQRWVREHDQENLTTWYSVEYLHPALLFTKRELLNGDINILKERAGTYLKNHEAREKRSEDVTHELQIIGLVPRAKNYIDD